MWLFVLMAARRQNTFKAKPGRMASISLHSIRLEKSSVPLRMLSQRLAKAWTAGTAR